MTYNADLEITLYKLSVEQMRCFADKEGKPRKEAKAVLSDSPAPRPESADSPTPERPSYFDRLVWLFKDTVSWPEAERLARQIRDATDWEEYGGAIFLWIEEKLSAKDPPETRKWAERIVELAEVGELEAVIYEQWHAQQE